MSKSVQQQHPHDIDLVICDEVDSTSDELRRILQLGSHDADAFSKKGAQAPFTRIKVVRAHKQTKGRGRLGRSWTSSPGGLFFSFSLDTSDMPQDCAALSLVAALGVRSTLAVCTDQAQPDTVEQGIKVKWPNDVMCSKGKLVGILVEQVPLAVDKRAAIIGVGINVERPLAGAHEAAAYLSDLTNKSFDYNALLIQVVNSVCSYCELWRVAGYSFDQLRNEYNSVLAMKGDWVRVSTSAAQLIAEGTVLGVDEGGRLQLQDSDGHPVAINAGEITLRQ